jgi:hypothetical protein
MRLDMRTALLASLVVVGCGGGNKATPDVALPPDALFDAPMPPPNVHRYVIDHETLPQNTNQAREFGLDLNNDGTVDNQLGMVFATLSSMGFDSQAATDKAIDTGQIIALADLEADSLATGAATFTMFDGANAMPSPCHGAADTTCRHHLAGTATFDVAASSARDTPLAGTIAGAAFTTTTAGHIHLANVFGSPSSIQLIGAKVKLALLTDPSISDSVVAGGISQTEIDAKVIPGMQQQFMALVTRDCTNLASPPTCGCADGSSGKTVLGLFDADHNCMISTAEVKGNALITSLLMPDVTLEGQPCLSLGVQVHAVHAAFAP